MSEMTPPPPPPPPPMVPPPPPSFAYSHQHRELASFWLRLGGFFIDWLLFQVAAFIVGLVFGLGAIGVSASFGDDAFQRANDGSNVGQLVLIVVQLFVTAGFVSLKGQSIGMMAVNVRCQHRDTGANLSFWAAFGRSAMAWVSCCIIVLGYLWMLWDEDKQTWHDKVVDSVVVRT